MYRCQLCNIVVPPSVPSCRVTIESRAVVYPKRPEIYMVRHDHQKKTRDDPGGAGTAIVREVTACPVCAATRGT